MQKKSQIAEEDVVSLQRPEGWHSAANLKVQKLLDSYGTRSKSWYHVSLQHQKPACWYLGTWRKVEDLVVVQLTLLFALLLLTGEYWELFLQRIFVCAFISKESSVCVLGRLHNTN